MMHILATGLTGLVGSRIRELLSDSYTFTSISRASGVDMTNSQQVTDAILSSSADIVLHLAAKTNVDGCEQDKDKKEQGEAWILNVLATEAVAKACEQSGKKLVYISTDFVFDGEKEYYTEEDLPHPLNWYAQTKYEGEQRVRKLKTPWLILRIAYPYRQFFERLDFVRAILQNLLLNKASSVVTDHIFTPTFIDDIAYGLDSLLQKQQTGIFHVVGGESLTPFHAAQLLAETVGKEPSLIVPTTRDVYFANKATRPFQLRLKNDKITNLGVRMRSFSEAVALFRPKHL